MDFRPDAIPNTALAQRQGPVCCSEIALQELILRCCLPFVQQQMLSHLLLGGVSGYGLVLFCFTSLFRF